MSWMQQLAWQGLLLVCGACQAATVNLCSNERGLGAGELNLNDAVKQGGVVTFACPPGTVIRVTAPIYLTADVVIDGGGHITLDGGRSASIFQSTSAVSRIELRHLGIKDAALPAAHHPDAASVVWSSTAQLKLVDVEVTASQLPFKAPSVEVVGGHFAYNTDTVIRTAWLSIQGQAKFERNGSPFSNSLDAATGEATVDGAEFTGNQHIVWRGGLTMSQVRFFSNSAPATAPGQHGGALAVSGKVAISHASFYGNRADQGSGGAIAFGGGTLSLRRVTFQDNAAAQMGGAMATVSDPSVSGASQVDIRYCTFTSNRATSGGALGISGRPDHRWTVTTSTFTQNAALTSDPTVSAAGGAVWVEGSTPVAMSRTLFANNHATGRGGALAQRHSFTPASVVLVNSVVAANVSDAGAGALTLANAELVNVTVAGNNGLGVQPDVPPLLFGNGARLNGRIGLKNSIVANNTRGNCGAMHRQVQWVDGGHNLQWPGNACGPAMVSADPLLDSYFVVAPNSPARNGGDVSVCRSAPVSGQDLYGEVRPHGSASCTVGAVEDTVERRAVDRLVRSRSPQELPALLKGLFELVNKAWWGQRADHGGG